jgi:hypothetical protein
MRSGRDMHPASGAWEEGRPMDDRFDRKEGTIAALKAPAAALGWRSASLEAEGKNLSRL